ncbi:hypothetical protein M2G36_21315 [Vibrio vulnificus]|nr:MULTISPECIES: hypothetical protein [Vibrio]MCU8121556.1 hypothetical protein [Vibrio vulnificus]MCU8181778.1 hypothetical protein [Vibrio vulnificus]MCU8185987.1 hypothetical protein [Vibrio vulnificus]MCU8356827.1 hypothetical protein [Vibrio vulnificus]MCU8382619.1 hypothetical protein [Vibrio vulnificus]
MAFSVCVGFSGYGTMR